MRKRLDPEKTDEELTDNQRVIIETAVENPDWSYSDIADEVNLSESYVGKIHREYVEETIIPEDVDWSSVDEDLYEMIVAGLEAMDDVVRVEHQYDLDLSQGDSKEVDVAVWTESSGREVLTIMECKFHQDAVEQEVASEVFRNVNNSAANMAVIISRNGFQQGAISQADDAGHELYTLRELQEGDAEGYIQRINYTVSIDSPSVDIHGVSLSPVVDPVDMSPGVHQLDISGPEFVQETLWDSDYNHTDRTVLDLAHDLCSSRDIGVYRESPDDILVNINGIFCYIDDFRFECLPDNSESAVEDSVDMFEQYDIVMIDELADEEDDREFYSLERALESFVNKVQESS